MSDWNESVNGNFVYVIDDNQVMTVFKKLGSDEWGGVYDDNFLKGSFDTPEEAQKVLERYVFNDEKNLVTVCKTGWQVSKKGGFYKRSARGIVTVKQAKNGKWFVILNQGIMLKENWFNTADEAKQKANTFI